jgi:hypothetical protein
MSQLKQNKPAYYFTAALCILLIACGTLKKEKTLKSDNLTVAYRSFNRLGADYNVLKPEHPSQISEKEIQAHLQALSYKPFTIRSQVSPVFESDQIKEVSRLITKGLSRAEPNKYLHFEFKANKGLTEGDVFAADGYIHWRIWKINGVEYSNDPLKIRKRTWSMVTSPGQRYFISAASGQKKTKNWIVANFNIAKLQRGRVVKTLKRTPQMASDLPPRPEQTEQPQTSGNGKLSTKKKLMMLRQFYQQKLIDEEEYQQKKKQLMEEF